MSSRMSNMRVGHDDSNMLVACVEEEIAGQQRSSSRS